MDRQRGRAGGRIGSLCGDAAGTNLFRNVSNGNAGPPTVVIRWIAFYGIMLAVAFAACDSRPQSPTPVTPPPASPPPSAQPSPMPPGTNPSSYLLAGSYTLTLDIGSGCPAIPDAERSRQYTATIEYASGGRYVVTLSDATFLTGSICTAGSGHFSGIGCHQFFASEDIDTAHFFLENNNDDAHGGHVVERLSSGTWLEVIGAAVGKFDSSSIEASGSGSVWYCRTPSSYPFPCSNFVGCSSTDMRLTLRRR